MFPASAGRGNPLLFCDSLVPAQVRAAFPRNPRFVASAGQGPS